VLNLKPAQKQNKYNMKTVQIHKNGTLKQKKKNNKEALRNSNINEVLRQTP
jgi:hypothetical protein